MTTGRDPAQRRTTGVRRFALVKNSITVLGVLGAAAVSAGLALQQPAGTAATTPDPATGPAHGGATLGDASRQQRAARKARRLRRLQATTPTPEPPTPTPSRAAGTAAPPRPATRATTSPPATPRPTHRPTPRPTPIPVSAPTAPPSAVSHGS